MKELETKLYDLEEEVLENKRDIRNLSELQTKHEHLDEIRAVKQDQLMASIQTLVSSIKNYQSDLHEMVIKNTEDIVKQDVLLASTSTRVKILYAAGAIFLGAMLTGMFEWLPQILQFLSKGK